MSAAVFGAAAGSALGGTLSDQIGRRAALKVGDVGFVLGALLMGFAPDPATLIAG